MSATTQEHAGSVELNGVNVIREDERGGKPRQLFWPWFAANISVLGLSYGSFVLGFGISFWQASVAGTAMCAGFRSRSWWPGPSSAGAW